jgi:hypothetical protein
VVAPQTPDETRVLDQLRAQKVITAKTQILSTRWNQSRHEWQIDLLHAGGLWTRWFSDSVGYNYSGGSLKR